MNTHVTPAIRAATAYLENVKADSTASNVDIRVETRSIELDIRGNVGVIGREQDGDLEAQPGIDLRDKNEWRTTRQ
jgi:hypothetical protein